MRASVLPALLAQVLLGIGHVALAGFGEAASRRAASAPDSRVPVYSASAIQEATCSASVRIGSALTGCSPVCCRGKRAAVSLTWLLRPTGAVRLRLRVPRGSWPGAAGLASVTGGRQRGYCCCGSGAGPGGDSAMLRRLAGPLEGGRGSLAPSPYTGAASWLGAVSRRPPAAGRAPAPAGCQKRGHRCPGPAHPVPTTTTATAATAPISSRASSSAAGKPRAGRSGWQACRQLSCCQPLSDTPPGLHRTQQADLMQHQVRGGAPCAAGAGLHSSLGQ